MAMKLEPRRRFKQKRSGSVLEKKGVINVGVTVSLKLHRPKRGIEVNSIKIIRFLFLSDQRIVSSRGVPGCGDGETSE